MGKLAGIEFGLVPPEGPHHLDDFALGVEPRMSGGADLAEGSLIKIPNGTLLAFGRLEIGAIGDGLQEGMALTVELFKAQRFTVAGLVADGEATEACELGEIFKPGWIDDEGDKEVSADDADTRDGLQMLDFGKGSASLKHEATSLVLIQEGLIQGLIKQARLGTQEVMRQLLEPAWAVRG